MAGVKGPRKISDHHNVTSAKPQGKKGIPSNFKKVAGVALAKLETLQPTNKSLAKKAKQKWSNRTFKPIKPTKNHQFEKHLAKNLPCNRR